MEANLYDIIIIGYGPTGATLANILGQYGHRVAIIEKEQEIYPFPRAVHLDDETLRIFQSLGIFKELKDALKFFNKMQLSAKIGQPLVQLTIGNELGKYGFGSDYWFDQPHLEQALRKKCQQSTFITEFIGWEAIRLTQTDEVVLLKIKQGDQIKHLTARYLIGADGANSITRKQLNISFSDLKFNQKWLVVDTLWNNTPPKKWPPLHQQICDPKQPISFIPGVGKHYRWEFMLDQRSAQSSSKELAKHHLKQLRVDKEVTIIRHAVYSFQAKIAQSWQKGRIFLLGDAAHQMPPFLGQGMCSGIRDAHNLGWKLHLCLQQLSPSSILHTYQQERHSHVTRLIKGAIILGSVIQTRNPFVALIRNTILRFLNLSPLLLSFIKNQIVKKEDIHSGFLGRHTKRLKGKLFIQPFVHQQTAASKVLLDECLGNGFALILQCPIPLHQIRNLAKRIHLCILTIDFEDDNGQSIHDYNNLLKDWFRTNRVDFVLLRPDRHIYDAGKASAFPKIFQSFLNQFNELISNYES